ncbi:hypothetical protein EVAR_65516_1 [Eumeta japonica]|uniref:Uncharacterized protein n=1 Tax=Eumeta variegata TaxID=151549 RepID=A0A4C1ZE33_EUMVA|nr:hypothetical protein EVAR_65516_1 [Eumeta japonica]
MPDCEPVQEACAVSVPDWRSGSDPTCCAGVRAAFAFIYCAKEKRPLIRIRDSYTLIDLFMSGMPTLGWS